MSNDILSYIPDFNIGNVLQPSEVRYLYNDLPVPRASDILDMVNNPYLLDWANRVGLYQHKSHVEYQDLALSIGTYVHDFIYNYIKNPNERTLKLEQVGHDECLELFKEYQY